MKEATPPERILALARERKIIRPRDLGKIPSMHLLRLVRKGQLVRLSRGIYSLSDGQSTEHHSLAVVSKQTPRIIVCLLSALRFHELTTQQPSEIWLAIGNKSWAPAVDSVKLRIIRFSGEALRAGVKSHDIEGVPVRVFNPAKTVADCFKHRNTIGLDVAIEALRGALRRKKATVDEIERYARVCRVSRVIRPYFEALA
ncbi:MAG TPA: type IV toxin-antitoxin system AbiEi family antitoxin domain-containing protein [Bryobacteraceae bacterium]|nr:type IV toxin-antitoxin system AbiEi family antitoxin domain-containing protein [Bryobacteraceae bacterium]